MVYHSKDTLSQNFIKYPRLVRELLTATNLTRDDTVIEIGPGKGIITTQLADRVKQVIAIEKDSNLSFNDLPNVSLVHLDFLDFKLPSYNYKIVANLPFNSTAKIISKILKSPHLPDSMFLIMQLETAEKFIGIPFETQSSVLTKPFYDIKILGEIDRTNFTKKPQVKIVFTAFYHRDPPYIQDSDRPDFRDFVVYGFNQWQLTFLDAYKKVFTYPQLTNLKKIYQLATLKPSEVSFDTWLQVYKTYKRIASEDQKDTVRLYRRQYNRQMENY